MAMHSVKLHLRDERTDRQKDSSLSVRPFVRLFVFLSVVSVRGVHPIGRTKPGASLKFKRGGGKIRDQ